MSLIKILVVWTPESILNLIIILLIAGLKDQLKIKDLRNLGRFVSSVFCMVISSIFIFPLVNFNVVINCFFHIITYTLIFFAIYRIDIQKAFICTLLMMFTFITLENTYYPFLIAYVSGGIAEYNNNITQYIIFSSITRIVQLGLIGFLWNNQYVFLVTRLNKKLYNVFSVFIAILLMSEICLSFIFAIYFSSMTVGYQIIYGAVLVTMIVLFYVLIYKIIYSSIKSIIVQGYKQYQILEQGAEDAFKRVYSLLEKNDFESAKNYVSLLIGSDENNKTDGGDKYEG